MTEKGISPRPSDQLHVHVVARQPGVREICLPDAVEELFRAPAARHTGFAAWTLLFYALWHRHHIERLATAPDVFATLAAA